MEKQDVPKSPAEQFIIALDCTTSGLLIATRILLYTIIFLTSLSLIFLLAKTGYLGLATILYKLVYIELILLVIGFCLLLYRAFVNYIWKSRKLQMEKRREEFKNELREEIIKELKLNGRRKR